MAITSHFEWLMYARYLVKSTKLAVREDFLGAPLAHRYTEFPTRGWCGSQYIDRLKRMQRKAAFQWL